MTAGERDRAPPSGRPGSPNQRPAVAYPSACSPQAWAAATPLLLLRVLLGLEPVDGKLRVDPVVPEGIGRLALRGIPGRWTRADAVS